MEKYEKKLEKKDEELLKNVRSTQCLKDDIFCIDWLLVGRSPVG